MSDRKVRLIAVLILIIVGGGILAVIPPLVINLAESAAKANYISPDVPRVLPSDLCEIDGRPLMPELDYIGYGNPPGLVLKYVNQEGDLVLLLEGQVKGIYEGDFCR